MPKRFELSEKGIMEALEFLGAELPRKKVSEKDIIKTRLLAEECLFKLAKDAAEGVVSQNKVPVSCTKTANYYISSIMMSLCTCL